MKKNVGSVLALYPTPLVIVGTIVDGKPNWTLVGHLGIIGHDRVMVGMAVPHYSNKGIRENKALSINIVDEAMLKKADHVGCVSGNKEDKSQVFAYTIGEGGAPIINEAPVAMTCTVDDTYETPGFENFICKITATYAEESVLTEDGKINYHVLKPVLFEMPTYEYLKTGEVLGKCMKLFQSTLPVRGATVDFFVDSGCNLISIHAPREGSDALFPRTTTRMDLFQSTLPVRGATLYPGFSGGQSPISIHAPREGSDHPVRWNPGWRPYFNPRSP